MRLASVMSKMPVLAELSDQSPEALRGGYEVLENAVEIARGIVQLS